MKFRRLKMRVNCRKCMQFFRAIVHVNTRCPYCGDDRVAYICKR